MVRARGEALHVGTEIGGVRDGTEFSLPIALGALGVGGETAQGDGVRGEGGRGAEGEAEGVDEQSHLSMIRRRVAGV